MPFAVPIFKVQGINAERQTSISGKCISMYVRDLPLHVSSVQLPTLVMLSEIQSSRLRKLRNSKGINRRSDIGPSRKEPEDQSYGW